MTISDPIADMLTRVRNALMTKHETVLIPASNTKIAIARVLKEEGFIQDYEVFRDTPQRTIKVYLRYTDNKEPVLAGLRRTSKPGLRQYAGKGKIPIVRGGLGIAILSTSQGVMAGNQARKKGLGGEVLCYVW
ncbi:MAG: 30S ribosomal protein S8 [Chloroflexi bacterium]|nr:30S ribosomal protein S8 [Chloroflexota bacterium]